MQWRVRPGRAASGLLLPFLLLFLFLIPAGPDEAAALTLRHTYRFDAARVEVHAQAGGATVSAGRLPSTWERGRPEIPYDVVTLLVPRGSRPLEIRAARGAERVVRQDLQFQLALPRPTDTGVLVDPPEPRDVGKPGTADAAYPAVSAELEGAAALMGYELVSVRVYPIRCAGEQLLACEAIEFEIDLGPGGPLPFDRQRYSPALEEQARRQLRRLVDNPEAIDGYERPIGALVETGRRGFHPSQAPSLEGSPVEYVIVTREALRPSFEALASWKTQRGVPTVVRTLEWIQANYKNGSDLQETLRTFIRDAYAKWSVRYVLLGGDTDVVPARYGFSRFGPETDELIPTDMYFACLDGNWNADGDALWGEAGVSALDPVDDTDFYAEVYVGRMPVSTVPEADALIAKLMTYENPTLTTYQNKLLFLSEVLFPVDWDGTQSISLDGAELSESELLPVLPGCTSLTRLYENYSEYPGTQPLTLANTLAQMNTGYGIVNHIGHGYRYNMSCGDQSLVNSHAAQLANGAQRFLLYFLNCTSAAFDFPCLAEAFLKANGGAVAVLGASRAAFALPSGHYNTDFFAALYDSVTPKNVGELFVASRLSWTQFTYYDSSDHYTHFLYNLLADPEMVVHTCQLGGTTASYPAQVGLGPSQVSVGVQVGGSPRADALVCLQKGQEEYVHGRTDATGSVTLDFVAESAGSALVTVSGPNMTTFVGTISVLAGGSPYVHVQALSVDDDGSSGTWGNADGVMDAGETVDLNVVFRNDGNTPAASVTGVLRISSPWATVVDSLYTVGSLGSGASIATTGQVRVLVATGTPDGTVLPCEFRSTDGVQVWKDVVNRVVHAPGLELVLLDVDDSAPGGNGDGTIQAGESFDLDVHFKNYGTGAIHSLTAYLITSDPDVVITTGLVQVGSAAPQQEVAAPSFRLQETSLDENRLTLVLSDAYSRFLLWQLTLRGPAPPATPVLDATQGANVVVSSWTPSSAADLAGYHVYRSLTGTGPWTRISVDRTARVAYYRDTGLQPSTQYYYYVTAVDSSGNESPPSGIAQINTNPAQLAGWPIGMAAVSSCPPAVGDITGDGSKEIVAGNSTLYAWDWRGIELVDDDLDPQTWGVFASEVGTVTAAIVLAEFDPAPGFEVFAASWSDSNKTFVVRGDGSFPGGWPQNPDPLSSLYGYWAAPAAMDLNGDGLAEIFAPAKNGNLYAWHPDGTPLGATPAWKSGLGTWSRCSPAIGNLDADPQAEIAYAAPDGRLHIWNADGTNLPGFPLTLGTLILSSPAIGDVNRDGRRDVVLVTEDDSLYVIDTQTARPLPGWPVYVSVSSDPISPSPALADFDFDGFLEIVVAHNAFAVNQSSVRVYNHQGQLLPGWPQLVGSHTSESSPIVADFSGDGIPDIVFGNEGGLIYGWDRNGQALTGFPLTIGDYVRSVPYADDVDGDGDIDLVLAGWDRNLWIWDFTSPWSPAAAQWPTFKHDPQRTGCYDFTMPTDTGDQPAPGGVPPRAFLAQNVPNPFNPLTSIAYGVPGLRDRAALEVQLDIHDVKGRRVRQLVRGAQLPGNYKALWDGRDDRGRPLQSGVYFYKLRVAGETHGRKMLLLR